MSAFSSSGPETSSQAKKDLAASYTFGSTILCVHLSRPILPAVSMSAHVGWPRSPAHWMTVSGNLVCGPHRSFCTLSAVSSLPLA